MKICDFAGRTKFVLPLVLSALALTTSAAQALPPSELAEEFGMCNGTAPAVNECRFSTFVPGHQYDGALLAAESAPGGAFSGTIDIWGDMTPVFDPLYDQTHSFVRCEIRGHASACAWVPDEVPNPAGSWPMLWEGVNVFARADGSGEWRAYLAKPFAGPVG